jgi:hypothetical protein
VARALADTRACVLLVHGQNDQHVRVDQGRRLAVASPRVHYIEMQGEDHITLPLRLDLLGGVVDDWLAQEGRAGAQCAAPQMPREADRMVMARLQAQARRG